MESAHGTMEVVDHVTEAAEELLDPHPSEAAFRETLPEINALRMDQLQRLNLDVMSSITTALGALPQIMALRREIEEELKRFDFHQFDSLKRYALALNHAHARHRSASVMKTELTELAARVERLRDQLLADAQSLAGHGLIPGDRLRECKSEPGYKPMASDVLMLVNLIKHHWSKVRDNTPATLESLNQAATDALELLAAIGEKNEAPTTPSEAALTRQKAYTLFKNAYDAARRAVIFVRDEHGDADDIAPSLYAGRGGRGSDSDGRAREPAVPSDETEQAPGASNGGQSARLVVDNAAGLPITSPVQN